MTPGLKDTLVTHASGNPRALAIMADSLLAAAAGSRNPRRKALPGDLGRTRPAQGRTPVKGFPTRSPADLEDRAREQLVDGLWARQAVGIGGGEPKCGKSFLALDLAVAVAAGVPCLRRFEADEPGPVLLFAAEDAGHIVRTRLAGIARAAGADFETLDIAVIDVPTLRLDHRADRLLETVERIEPRLLVLDPLVRLHGVDENAAGEVAPILGFLRDLQRRFEAAVLLVHHARKSGATRPGQALRGSSELHAWGDSNLYLRRRDGQIVMTVEHRAAPGLNDIEIELADNGEGPALRLRRTVPDQAPPRPESAEQRIVQVLAKAESPLLQSEIRKRAGARNATVTAALHELVREGRVERGTGGRYRFLGAVANNEPDGQPQPIGEAARLPVPANP